MLEPAALVERLQYLSDRGVLVTLTEAGLKLIDRTMTTEHGC
jgi:DNA-binding MarR family transcriptional regulator